MPHVGVADCYVGHCPGILEDATSTNKSQVLGVLHLGLGQS